LKVFLVTLYNTGALICIISRLTNAGNHDSRTKPLISDYCISN